MSLKKDVLILALVANITDLLATNGLAKAMAENLTMVKAWEKVIGFPNARIKTSVLERLSTTYKNVLDNIDNINEGVLRKFYKSYRSWRS